MLIGSSMQEALFYFGNYLYKSEEFCYIHNSVCQHSLSRKDNHVIGLSARFLLNEVQRLVSISTAISRKKASGDCNISHNADG